MQNIRERNAKSIFMRHTQGTGRIEPYMYGPSNAVKRAEVLSAINGDNVPKSKAGWAVFRDEMFELYGVGQGCIAARESELVEKSVAEYETLDRKEPS